jgi:hypothetical protein
MQTHGHLDFGRNGLAEVFYAELSAGCGQVLNAIGHPYWHHILLLHPPGPYTLTLDDGTTMKLEFQNLDGIVRISA